MFSLPEVLALENTRIYICTSNSDNVISYIEKLVNECFSRWATLKIPDINLANSHIQFEGKFDYMRFINDMNIVENISRLDNSFYYTQINRHISVFDKIGDT